MYSSMVTVRTEVEAGNVLRPQTAVWIRRRMERIKAYAESVPGVDLDDQITEICAYVSLTANELHYLADVGEWIIVERDVRDLEDEDERAYWDDIENLPSLENFHRMNQLVMSRAAREEIDMLDALYYGTES